MLDCSLSGFLVLWIPKFLFDEIKVKVQGILFIYLFWINSNCSGAGFWSGGDIAEGGMNSVFSEAILAEKLSKVNSTQQCIESILPFHISHFLKFILFYFFKLWLLILLLGIPTF